MKNIALIAALISAGATSAQAHELFSSTGSESTPIPVVSTSFGRLSGYNSPFGKSVESANKGQYADAGEFGRNTAYGNAINKKHNISKGVYANVGEFGRLSGYGKAAIVNDQTAIASK